MIVFRHGDARFPFLWEQPAQPPARWHGPGEGPVHYFADTPNGAWAEFLRHEEITDEDVLTIRRGLWAVDLPALPRTRPALSKRTLTGDPQTYSACQNEARRLRRRGVKGLIVPSAALKKQAARGWRVEGGLVPGPARQGQVIVLFGRRPDLVGWLMAEWASPPAYLIEYVVYFYHENTHDAGT